MLSLEFMREWNLTIINILLADEQVLFREGLKRILGETDDMIVVGESPGTRDAVTVAVETHPDVVLLDAAMPGREPVETIEYLRRHCPRAKVLLLTGRPPDQFAVRYLQVGAAGYLTKACSPEELLEAIRAVARGGRVINPDLAERIAFTIGPDPELRPHERLSNREFEVLELIAEGRRPKEIAEDLHLSIKTVTTYRRRVLEKLNLGNTAELILYAVREGLV